MLEEIQIICKTFDKKTFNDGAFLERECEEGSDRSKSTWYSAEDVLVQAEKKVNLLLFSSFLFRNY